jgi:hypothetical protein
MSARNCETCGLSIAHLDSRARYCDNEGTCRQLAAALLRVNTLMWNVLAWQGSATRDAARYRIRRRLRTLLEDLSENALEGPGKGPRDLP